MKFKTKKSNTLNCFGILHYITVIGIIAAIFVSVFLVSCVNTKNSGDDTTDSSVESRPNESQSSGEESQQDTNDNKTTNPVEDDTSDRVNTDPIVEPDEDLKNALVISKVYGPGNNIDGALSCGFIELYNNSDKECLLDGVSVFYGEGKSFSRLDLDGYKIGKHGYFLIKCASCKGYDESTAVLKIDKYDLEWGISIDNKEFELAVGKRRAELETGGDFASNENIFSFVRASVLPNVDIYTVDDVSKNKMIVRTELNSTSGYHVLNLLKVSSAELAKITPKSSEGNVNTKIESKFTEVVFSKEGGVFKKAFTLNLSAPDGYKIYYTTDGSDPRTNGVEYKGGIRINDTDKMPWGNVIKTAIRKISGSTPSSNRLFGGTVIKACAKKGSDVTAVYTNTYFVSERLAASGVTLMSLSLDIDDFLGDENGAYYTYQYDLWATRPRSRAFMEVIGRDGEKKGGSYIEFAVSGNGSSGHPMKSLRLYYKKPLDLNDPATNSLEYDLFDGWAENVNGQTITSFKRILIRNSGNDFATTYLRDAFCQRMAKDLNVDSMASQPSLVFVNGEFWGMYNCRERYSPEYFNQRYGVLEENVAIVENESPLKYGSADFSWNNDYVSSAGDPAQATEFNNLVAYIKSHNLSDNEAYKYVSDRIDVDSFIDYWIVSTYFCNMDWPGNNIKVWRNTNESDPSGMDTKWRFVLLDLDHCLAYANCNNYTTYMFDRINNSTRCGSVMYGFMQNEEFKKKFATRAYELVTEYFAPEYSTEILNQMADDLDPIIDYQFERYASGGSRGYWNSQLLVMRDFLANRPSNYLSQIYSYTGYSEEELSHNSNKRVNVNYNENRLTLKVNGSVISSGSTVTFPSDGGEAEVEALAKDGYIITNISYTDKNGKVTNVEGNKAKFKITASGSITVYVKSTSQSEAKTNSMITAGMASVFYLDSNGDLYAWGQNSGGALGIGNIQSIVTVPTYVMGDVAKVATSHGFDAAEANSFVTAVLTLDGKLYTVGSNSSSQLGRTGNTTELLPINFSGKIVDVAVGYDHLLILDDKGGLWGVGNNSHGQLGNSGYGSNVSTFQKIADDVVKVSAGRRNSYYVDKSGNLCALGDNRWNKVHEGSTEDIIRPYRVCTDVANVYGGEHQMLVLKNDGTLYYLGWRRFDNFQQTDSQPDCPNGVLYEVCKNVVDAGIQDLHIVALTKDGSVYGYGYNSYSQITAGGSMVVGSAKKITDRAVDVAAGSGFTTIMKEDGSIVTLGRNDLGQAGNGKTSSTVNMAMAQIN